MSWFIYYIWFFFLPAPDGSCAHPPETDREKTVIAALMERNVTFRWLQGKMRARIQADGEVMTGSLVFKLQKDTASLLSVRKFGLEAARIYADSSSCTILYRLENTYEKKDIQSLAKKYGFDADHGDLQALIAGNILLPDSYKVDTVSDALYDIVTGTIGTLQIRYFIDKESLMLHKAIVRDSTNRVSTFTFDDYRTIDGVGSVAFQRMITTEGVDGSAIIELACEEMVFNEWLDIQFSIPDSYERID